MGEDRLGGRVYTSEVEEYRMRGRPQGTWTNRMDEYLNDC